MPFTSVGSLTPYSSNKTMVVIIGVPIITVVLCPTKNDINRNTGVF
ncbi:hypothetical protein VPHD292_0049 [Vibrio phage D292]